MKNRIRSFQIGSLLVITLIIIVGSVLILRENKAALIRSTEESMRRVLDTAGKGLDLWIGEKMRVVGRFGKNAEVVTLTQAFLEMDYHDAEALVQSPLQARARAYFESHKDVFGDVGFFLIAPDGISMASRRDNVGIYNPIYLNDRERFDRVMQGETLFIPPFLSDIPDSPMTMFILTPIQEPGGRVIGAISQRLIPERDFLRVIELAKISDDAWTYAVDSRGRILADNNVHVMAPEGLELNDPTRRNSADDPNPGLHALVNQDGVEVFSMWLWDSTLEIWLVAQMDQKQALAPYTHSRAMILLILGGSLLLVVAVLFALASVTNRTGAALKQARLALEEKVELRTRDLKEVSERAQEAAEAKARFLANMSHEIRTPMNAILGFTDLTLEEPLPERARDYLMKVRRSTRFLLEIINDILDFSKIEAGKLELEDRCFHLDELINETLESFQPRCQTKGLTLDLNMGERVSGCYQGDPVKLKQVLFNILGNAVKFTETGGVALSATHDGEQLSFTVRDTGIGLEPALVETIFEPFSQADSATTRRFGGTGLGTSISKRIVEAMGGKIWIESELGVGTSVFFTVKLPPTVCTEACFSVASEDEARLYSPRLFNILLVEDADLNAELVQLVLHDHLGHQVTRVENGRAAVEVVQAGTLFDLVLMDYHMPVLNGIEATGEIRKWEGPSGNHLSILALTASASLQEQKACLAAGMDGYVRKPIDFADLAAQMEKIVPAGAGVPNTAGKLVHQGKPSGFESLAAVADVGQGLRAWMDMDAYLKALQGFARDHGGDVLKLRTLIRAGKWADARRVAHTLAGLSLGLIHVSPIARNLKFHLENEDVGLAESHLKELDDAIKRVIQSVELCQEPERTGLALEPDEAKQIGGLTASLLVILRDDNPDSAEPVLALIETHLGEDLLAPIRLAISKYDFRKAEIETKQLVTYLFDSGREIRHAKEDFDRR